MQTIKHVIAICLSFFPRKVLRILISWMPYFDFIRETKSTQVPITFDHWYDRYVDRLDYDAYWPTHKTSVIINPKNVYCGVETSPGYMSSNYIQAIGKIYIGDYTQIGPSVGIISANHILTDNRKHIVSSVYIGKYCWIGFSATILPGVILGDYTIVAAGAVVSKSFSEGYCVVAGVPAKIVKMLDKSQCVFHKSEHEYNGFIKSNDFHKYKIEELKSFSEV
jgi:acetyltransferase-like isoleucine patch superfamily enzyme